MSDDAPVPEPRRIVAGLMLVLFLAAINQTIVAVALPRLAERLDGFGLLAWVIGGYLVAATVAAPVYGKLCDRYGPRRVLAAALGLFAAGSLGCALAQTMAQLIGWRVLQGFGGGGLICSAQAAIAHAVPLRERGRYQAYISGMFALGSVFGPVAGGWLTQWMSWRAVFAANLPLAAAALFATQRSLRALPLPVADARARIDVAGALLLALGVSSLMIAITRVGQGLPWLDEANARWIAAGALLVAAFAWREARAEDPLLPLTLARRRIVGLGLLTQFLAHGTMVTLTVMVPLELQLVAGLAPGQAAVQLIALSLGVPVGAMLAGRWVLRTGRYRPAQTLGASITATAVFGLAATLWLDAPHALALALLSAAGVGFGLQFPTTQVAVQNDTPKPQLGAVIAAVNFVRSLGGALGIAVLSTTLLQLLAADAPEAVHGGGAQVLRALTADGADGLRASMQPVAERAFALIFALCGLGSLVVLALFRAMPERPLRA
jgi:EmrB/QacA subfamily drug resistance transporter